MHAAALGLLFVLVFGGLPAGALADEWGFDGGSRRSGEPTTVVDVLSGAWDRPARGGRDAAVTVVVFTDYECPFCAKLETTLDQIVERYGDEIQVVARHYPLDFHPNARPAALTAEAAHAQGAFWDVHRRLFAQQRDLSDEALVLIARRAGLDTDAFHVDRASDAMAVAVETDVAWARQLGVSGTPATFVNGQMVSGAQKLDAFVALIDAELERAARMRALHPEVDGGSISAALTALNLELDEAPQPGLRQPFDLSAAAAIDGPDDAWLTAVAFVDYRERDRARELDALVDAMDRLYGDALRVAWVPRAMGLDAVDAWLAAVALTAAERDQFAPVHDCLVDALGDDALGLCHGTDDACREALDDVQARTRDALTACEIVEPDALLAAVDDDALARADENRRVGIRAGAISPNAFHINGLTAQVLPLQRDAIVQLDGELERARKIGGALPTELRYALLATEALAQPRTHVPVLDRPQRGPDDAPVTIVEFTDFECPFCSRAHRTMQALRERYPDDVRIVTAHLPLSFHTNARPAAQAAWAAQQQGRFDELAALLFANQKALSDATYLELAGQLGLDLDRFDQDRASQAAADAIDRDLDEARRVGATGTPSFFINGRDLSGAMPLETFAAIVDEEIALAEVARDAHATDPWYDQVTSLFGAADATGRTRHTLDLRMRPSTGRDDALVTVGVAGCLLGDACGSSVEQIAALRKAYSDKELRIVWLSYPQAGVEYAWPAARAARAAGRQGKLFEFVEILTQRHDDPGPALWEDIAVGLKLDRDQFVADSGSPGVEWAIDRDVATAARLGLSSTPAWIVNGNVLSGTQTLEQLVAAVDDELAHARKLVRDGTVRDAGEVYAYVTGDVAARQAGRVDASGMLTAGAAAPKSKKSNKKPAHQVALFVALDNPAAVQAMVVMLDLAQVVGDPTEGVELVVVPLAPDDESDPAARAARAALAIGDFERALRLGVALHSGERARDDFEDTLRLALTATGEDADAVLGAVQSTAIDAALDDARTRQAALGVLGEPTFVVDGVAMRGVLTSDELLRWIGR